MNKSSSSPVYDGGFYEYINAGSLSSARVVCPLIKEWLSPLSVLDVGCGAGAWCKVWGEVGVGQVAGVDGDYIDQSTLLIDPHQFTSRDLSQSFDMQRQYDLVVSLEVAEHVPLSSAKTFVENLVQHGKTVLFSAAVPGQGGLYHVNEQPLEFWRALFAESGYRCFDPLRPLLVSDHKVEPWYRYNTLLYVAEELVAGLPASVASTEVPQGTDIAELAPWAWRVRNRILGQLPGPVSRQLVRVKHNFTIWRGRH